MIDSNIHPDLFPESLLVSAGPAGVYTDSMRVAEHFGKRHKNVLRAIEKLLSDLQSGGGKLGGQPGFAGLNFEPSWYLDSTGRTLPMYLITEEGFAILAMGFTGRSALEWKVRFLAAFRDMERQLAARTERYARALDLVRPCLRPVVEATEAGLPRREIAGPLGKSAASVTYHRRIARQLGLLH